MAGTTLKPITAEKWTQVADAATSGYFQNTTKRIILINESATDPTANVLTGHEYEPKDREYFASTLGLWCRLTGAQIDGANITVTEN